MDRRANRLGAKINPVNGKMTPLDEFKKFAEDFRLESDRAIVVLTAARLDFMLSQIFEKFCVPNVSKSDELFDNQGPLSTFSNKILLAYRLGHIDRQFAQSLNLVRKIRNGFAHEPTECALDKGVYKSQVIALTSPYKNFDFYKLFREETLPKVAESRADYMTVVGLLIVRLEFLFDSLTPVDTERSWAVVNEVMRKFKKDTPSDPAATATEPPALENPPAS